MAGWHVYGADGIEKKIASNIVATNPIINGGVSGTAIDTDATFAANSDTLLASQKATKSYLVAQLGAAAGNLFGLFLNNHVTGTGDFGAGSLIIPKSTVALQEAQIQLDSTRRVPVYSDSVKTRAMGEIGYAPFAYPLDYSPTGTLTTNMNNDPAGKMWLLPMLVTGHMNLRGISVKCDSTEGDRKFGWLLLEQRDQDDNTLYVVARSNADVTVGAAGVINSAVFGATVHIFPGIYWLGVQNRHASSNIRWASISGYGTHLMNYQLLESVTIPNPHTTDIVMDTYFPAGSGSGNIPVCRLYGSLFGRTTGLEGI